MSRVNLHPSVVKKNLQSNTILERAFAALGFPPVTEHKFHPERRWRFDLAWPEKFVAVEIEGGIWRKGGGAHSHPSNIMRDIEKGNAAVLLGWRILRYPPEKMLAKVPEVVALLQSLPGVV